ncbi:sensor histidine kinase [Paenibacillus sp. GP183]|jgi:two-component system sensor histidine kinase YesM|uniref:sensor histidine kinase n=1 Tax=Paenibacillus sp. GP183 TaxID=1882751 RepID=UPI000896C21F|nr:sensor histidine kinase [Paenibacillus sp. GP183]SEC42335.1 two-component system, sensor histidine kinase YesM [Paenibacillus sp. GP183]
MKRTSIRLRLMILMIFLTTLPIITVTTIATNNTRDSVEKELINANNSRMLWADQYLKELTQQIDILFYTLQINQQLITNLNNMDYPDVGVQFSTQNYIKDTLTTVFHANSRKIDNLDLYIHPSQKAFSISYANSGIIFSLDIQNGNWSRMLHTPVNMYFKQSSDGIYAYHSMNRFEDRKLLGGLSVRINKQVWKEVIDILKSEPESSVFLINDEGEFLSGSSSTKESIEIQSRLRSLNLQNSELNFLKTNDYFYFFKQVGDGELTVAKAIPVETVNQSARPTIRAGILTGLVFAIVSILLSIFVSLRISRPIVSLARTMRTTHISNFTMKSVQSRDEIGLLESGYNQMMQRMKELIEGELQKEIEVKNAQLNALQAQINPHFLNNTLHLIGGMALSKNAPEIYHIARVIGELMRYSISSEGIIVSLEDELKHMRNYLFIQEQRFAGRCTVIVSTDESPLSCLIPKFSLQPLVENAFEHGLQRKEGAWKIEIQVKQISSRIAVLIKDGGVGIEPDKLQQLRMDLQGGLSLKTIVEKQDEPRKRKSIGLSNVQARLKLQFGEQYGIRIFSKVDVGTLVVMSLPISRKGGDADA